MPSATTTTALTPVGMLRPPVFAATSSPDPRVGFPARRTVAVRAVGFDAVAGKRLTGRGNTMPGPLVAPSQAATQGGITGCLACRLSPAAVTEAIGQWGEQTRAAPVREYARRASAPRPGLPPAGDPISSAGESGRGASAAVPRARRGA